MKSRIQEKISERYVVNVCPLPLTWLMILVGLAIGKPIYAQEWLNPACSAYTSSLVPWWCTVELENEDRKNRLRRLAKIIPGVQTPLFFQEEVPKEKLGDLLNHSPLQRIPVLRVIFKDRVFFDTAKSDLRPEANKVIDLVAESLRREPPDVALFVAGHTDSRGSEEYNYNLSVDRANTVARALVERGVGLAAIWRVGFGESVPIASNNTALGRAQNRRVEFLFAAKPAAVAVWLANQMEAPCIGASDEDARDCKHEITVQKKKVIALPVVKGQKDIQRPDASREVILPGNAQKRIIKSQPVSREVDIERHSAIIIDLDNHTYTVSPPEV